MALDTSYLFEVFNHLKAFSIMGQHVSRTDFEWTDQEEPHAKRRGEILSKLVLLLLHFLLLIVVCTVRCYNIETDAAVLLLLPS